ncbi:Hypothetical_protein [Hexamita inflata]|uniref:Hypothetical_protein n=1 Tax=Hexamita inflata TaxID=28002 RepID=A0ABP1KLF1_9EUKA
MKPILIIWQIINYKNYQYISHFLETAQTDFIETFESETQALARQCFHFQNGLNPLFRCIGIAWWWLPLMHCFINLIRYLGSFLVYLILQYILFFLDYMRQLVSILQAGVKGVHVTNNIQLRDSSSSRYGSQNTKIQLTLIIAVKPSSPESQ